MVFDATISLGGIINIAVIVCGGIAFIVSIKSTLSVLAISVSALSDRVSGVETDLKALNQVVVTNAVNQEKIGGLRGDLASFMNTYLINHQQLRKDMEARIDRLERATRP